MSVEVAQTINAERYQKLLPERTEIWDANVVMHRSLCHSIWNTISEFLTWYVYLRFYRRKPQCQFFPDTLYDMIHHPWECILNFRFRNGRLNSEHVMFNPRPGGGLSHLHHGWGRGGGVSG